MNFDTEEVLALLAEYVEEYPKTYSDKVYNAVTIDEGIEEVEQVGVRRGLELAISIIKGRK